MAEEKVIGKIGITPKGEYNPGVIYDILDTVSHDGNSYVSRVALNTFPLDDLEAWMLSAKKGDPGIKGDTFAFDDLTTAQKEELKGDVIAYNSLDELDKNDLASRVPILGVIEEGNTQAVSGGEVFKFAQNKSEIFDVVGFEKSTEFYVDWLDGYYPSASTSLDDSLYMPGVNDTHSCEPISIVKGQSLIIENLTDPPASSLGKIINSDGVFLKNLTIGDFENLGDDNYAITIDIDDTSSILFTLKGIDIANFHIYRTNQEFKIKEELLPNPTDTASYMYLRGLNNAKFNTGYYGLAMSGQSNQEGRESLVNLPTEIPSLLTNVLLYNRNTSEFENAQLGVNTGASNNADTRWGYDWVVMNLLADYHSQLYGVKRTYGGTPLAANLEGTSYNRTLNARYEDILPQTALMVTKQFEINLIEAFNFSETNSINIKYKAFLWMQGEADAGNSKWEKEYYKNLIEYIAYMRGIFSNPTLTFVIVTMHKDSEQYSQIVRDAQIKAAGKQFIYDGSTLSETTLNGDSNTWLYNMDGHPWTHIGDNLHMDASMNLLVGNDIFEMIKDL